MVHEDRQGEPRSVSAMAVSRAGFSCARTAVRIQYSTNSPPAFACVSGKPTTTLGEVRRQQGSGSGHGGWVVVMTRDCTVLNGATRLIRSCGR